MADKCPCDKDTKTLMLQCKNEDCKKWWHAQCVRLTGLSKNELKKLEKWLCPYCYRLPEAATVEVSLEVVHQEIADLKTGLNHIVESITSHVDKNSEVQTKSWSDLFKTNNNTQGQQIQEVVAQVVQKSKQKMDFDHTERERRKKNVVVKEVIEPTAGSNDDKKAEDKTKAAQILDIDESEIEFVKRAGIPKTPTREDPNPSPRPLIITVKSPVLASDLHGHGRGRRALNPDIEDHESWLWINPDLIQADRKANFLAREEMRKKRNQRQSRAGQDSGVQTRSNSFLTQTATADSD